jgi:hypothetical protein
MKAMMLDLHLDLMSFQQMETSMGWWMGEMKVLRLVLPAAILLVVMMAMHLY